MINFRDEQGSALLLTIVVTVILLFVGSALGLYSMVERRQAQQELCDMQAYYIARSGADALAHAIMAEPQKIKTLIESTEERDFVFEEIQFEDTTTGICSLSLIIEEDNDIRIVSTGKIGGTSRTVEVELELSKQLVEFNFKEAVFAASGDSEDGAVIRLANSGSVEGDVATNATGTDSVHFTGNTKINGGLLVGPGVDVDDVLKVENNGPGVTGNKGNLPGPVVYPDVVFPEIPTVLGVGELKTVIRNNTIQKYVIEEDGVFDEIITSSNRLLEIDLGEGTRKIVVDDLKLGGPIKLTNVGGEGRLLLYIRNSASKVGGNLNINVEGIADNLTIYYSGSGTFWDDQYQIHGNIVVEKGTLFVGRGSTIEGNILSGGTNVKIEGNADVHGLIYAPQAHVHVSASGATGAIIAKTFEASGNAKIKYSKEHFEDSFVSSLINPEYTGETEQNYVMGFWRGK